MLTRATLKIGGRYNWKNQPERLIYTGMCEPRNGRWHQFQKVGAEPGSVWCEVLDEDLHRLEETRPAVTIHLTRDPATGEVLGCDPPGSPELGSDADQHDWHSTLGRAASGVDVPVKGQQ